MVLNASQFHHVISHLHTVQPQKNKRMQFQRYLLTYPSDVNVTEYIAWVKATKSKSKLNKPITLEVYPTTDKTGEVSMVFWECADKSSIIGQKYFVYKGLVPKVQVVREKDTWTSLLEFIDT